MVDTDIMLELTPPEHNYSCSVSQVAFGVPIPKQARVQLFSSEDWEVFIQEWAHSLKNEYAIDQQIIIFEHVEPPAELRGHIQLIEFTKNPNQGRYRFFPHYPSVE